MALYIAVNVSYYLVLTPADVLGSKDQTVATLFMLRLFGAVGGAVMSAAIMFSVFGSANASMLAGPRVIFAMAGDRLAPPAFGKVHPQWRTPALATVTLALWACVLVAAAAVASQTGYAGKKPLFDQMSDYAMFGAVIFETLTVLAIFALARQVPARRTAVPLPGVSVLAGSVRRGDGARLGEHVRHPADGIAGRPGVHRGGLRRLPVHRPPPAGSFQRGGRLNFVLTEPEASAKVRAGRRTVKNPESSQRVAPVRTFADASGSDGAAVQNRSSASSSEGSPTANGFERRK